MELHKSYIVLGLVIAFLLFFGIAARADEPTSNPKSQMVLTYQNRQAMAATQSCAWANGDEGRN